jgi:hypothetical protein
MLNLHVLRAKSEPFSICRYLHQNQGPGVHDYLCNKLYELPEKSLEKYLLQFVYLAVSRPASALERVIVDYCSKSFRVAVKVRCETPQLWLCTYVSAPSLPCRSTGSSWQSRKTSQRTSTSKTSEKRVRRQR